MTTACWIGVCIVGDVGSKTTFQLMGKTVAPGPRTREMVKARRLSCHLAIQGMSHSGAEVALCLRLMTSMINRLAVSPELPECKNYLKSL
jgi:hypothetical protein